MKVAVDSYKDFLISGLEIYGDKDKAIEYANKSSTAGSAAKAEAFKQLGW